MQTTMAKVMLMSSLILSTNLNAASQDLIGTLCLDRNGQAKVAMAIKDLEKCQVDLDAKNELIHERLETFAGSPSLAWWQTPEIIVSGVVVSVSVTALATMYIMRQK